MTPPANDCPADLLNEALELARDDNGRALQSLDTLLQDYPVDARLHFLRGSLLAAERQFDEARSAMRRAIDIAPGYSVARFQLGLLELSSGAPADADATLAPLADLPSTDSFHWLSQGLRHLMRDDFVDAIAKLQAGIALNTDNPAINGDMRLIIRSIEGLQSGEQTDEPTSSTHWLLQQHASRTTKH